MANGLNLEYDSMSRRAGKSKAVGVQVFRGVNFDDWLRLFMQVRITSVSFQLVDMYAVCISSDKARTIRDRR